MQIFIFHLKENLIKFGCNHENGFSLQLNPTIGQRDVPVFYGILKAQNLANLISASQLTPHPPSPLALHLLNSLCELGLYRSFAFVPILPLCDYNRLARGVKGKEQKGGGAERVLLEDTHICKYAIKSETCCRN